MATSADPTISADHYPELATYLADNIEHDPPTGCLLWTAGVDKGGHGVANSSIGRQHGTQQAARLAWLAHFGQPPPKGTALAPACGCRRCINPLHLTPVASNARPDGVGSVGALQIGRHTVPAKTAWAMQNVPAKGWLPFRLSTIFCCPASVVDLVRMVAPRATRTVLPDGFIRYDLPPGVTVIAPDDASGKPPADADAWPDDYPWVSDDPDLMAA